MQSNNQLIQPENIKNKFLQVRAFLREHQNIWQREVLNYFPQSLAAFPTIWLEEIEQFSLDDLYRIDGKQEYSHLPSGHFRQFIQQCRQLEQFPTAAPKENQYPTWAWYGVRGKKKHEIQRLIPFIKTYMEQSHTESLIDIGGGVGHLARILGHYEGIPITSVDIDSSLQAKGEIRQNKYPKPAGHQDLSFYCCEFNEHFSSDHLSKIITTAESCGLVGLHTCGNLANDFLKNMISSSLESSLESSLKIGINLGCCYLKLDPDKETNLSQFAQNHMLPHTKYSLTLATRGHLKLSREEFDYKIKVKKYRYLLHLWFLKQGIDRFISVGDSPPRDYATPFADYVDLKVREALSKSEISNQQAMSFLNISRQEKQDFFENSKTQKIFWKLFHCDLIRWQVGRLLEIDLLLDRAIYALENNLQVEAIQVFDEDISPRNIALVYTK